MNRKECAKMTRWIRRWAGRALTATLVVACGSGSLTAGVVRVWPTAVVASDVVTLGDICDLSRLGSEERRSVDQTVVMSAPPVGGSAYVTVATVQEALRRAGVNLASEVVEGATKCAVSRPKPASPEGSGVRSGSSSSRDPGVTRHTLRGAVYDAFEKLLESGGDRIELRFGRTSKQILNLSGPQYEFQVRVNGGRRLGRMINVDVDVLAGGQKVQTVHLVVNASVVRRIVVARRAINQNATVDSEDVQLADRLYDRLDNNVATDIEAVVGQRARRFIAADRPVLRNDLESVPLVYRGQIVDVVSLVGGIEARSVAKALDSGGLGDSIELRTGGRRGEMLTGIVTGQRRVMIGSGTSAHKGPDARLALGGGR